MNDKKYNFGNVGTIKSGIDVFSYQIGDEMGIDNLFLNDSLSHPIPSLVRLKGYNVYPWGVHNLEPQEVQAMIKDNRLIPELLAKKGKMLYGLGPTLYKIKKEGAKAWREYTSDPAVDAWLESWQDRGLEDDYKTYLKKCVQSYYYHEGLYSKYRLSRGAVARAGMPVIGLEHISCLRARMATKKDMHGITDFAASDFDLIAVGNWACIGFQDFQVYRKMDHSKAISRTSMVSFSGNPSEGDEVYSHNTFYRGIRSWIQGSNLTPKYINDYLKNALSARLHIIIPNKWLEEKKNQLEAMCATNEERGGGNEELLTISFGYKTMEVGTEYHEGLLREYANNELEKLTDYLSGKDNQGKLFASYSYNDGEGPEQRWKIEEIPQKYKEYIDALTSYDKRADDVMLSSIGLDSSLSNVSKEGIISKSGSDSYYNFLIYLKTLTIPEEIICKDINYALKLNFPALYNTGLRIGFYRDVVEQQQNVSEGDRMKNQQS